MCGIAGVLENVAERPRAGELQGMLKAIAHRGPDGEGIHISGPIALGHRRLAILDTGSGGAQPMSYAGGRYWITFNGELYNFIELRETLTGLGHSFRSESDTEVVLAAYAQWGERCLLRMNGMWALAIWDTSEKTLFLCRDRFGIKPLFYYVKNGRLAFGSEMKAFLSLSWFPSAFDASVLVRSIKDPYGLEGTEHCVLQGLRRLPPGHMLIIHPGGSPIVRRWWRTADHIEPTPDGFGEQSQRFGELFRESVALRMRSDVPIAFALSGGLDSSAVLCSAVQATTMGQKLGRVSSDWRTAHIATYPGTSSDERPFAEEVVAQSGVSAVYVEMDPDGIPDILDRLVFHCEEPQSPHIGPWFLYQEMKRSGLKVSLEGHGGDELLAGYVVHVQRALRNAISPQWKIFKALEYSGILRRMVTGQPGTGISFRDVATVSRRILRNCARGDIFSKGNRRGDEKRERFDDWYRATPIDEGSVEERLTEASGLPGLMARLYEDLHDRILPTILRDFDRYSMAHGVEVRTPFLDWRLVRYCVGLPENAVLGGGMTKRVLRESMRGILPESVRVRNSKIPYKSPLGEWWRGPLKEFTLDTVNSREFLESDIWNGEKIRSHVENQRNKDNLPAALLVFRFLTAYRLIYQFNSRRTENGTG